MSDQEDLPTHYNAKNSSESINDIESQNSASKFKDVHIDDHSIHDVNVEEKPIKGLGNRSSKHVFLRFRSIRYSVFQGRAREDKLILKNLSGYFRPGNLNVMMGPSGAGKSSLLNILTGFVSNGVSGDILINGRKRDMREFRKLSCYIMQVDHLLPHLTVNESLMYAAHLKISESVPDKNKQKIVDEIMNVLSLGGAKNTRASDLSGGQRKRLSIALELVNNPPIMFFDEPTSGLDSASCFQCITLLQTLAREGRTIVCTIHQPSAKVFEMIDHLYFLAEGRCIYQGPPQLLVSYLKTQDLICPTYHNPSDYFMEVACNEHGKNIDKLAENVLTKRIDQILNELYNENRNIEVNRTPGTSQQNFLSTINELAKVKSETIPEDEENLQATNTTSLLENSLNFGGRQHSSDSSLSIRPYDMTYFNLPNAIRGMELTSEEVQERVGNHTFATSPCKQFRVLVKRTFLSMVRDSTLTKLRFFSYLLTGLLIGLLYFRIGNEGALVFNNAAYLFFSLLFVMFTTLMPTVMTFPLEMDVFVKEHLNYWYSLKAYYFARTVADIPFQILFPIIYAGLSYFMTGQPVDAVRFFLFLLMCIMTSFVAQSMGLVIGAATSLDVAVYLGPVTGIPILLFSGFFVTLEIIPKYLQWLSYISYTRYSFRGSLLAIYSYNRTSLECSPTVNKNSGCFKKPTFILDMLGMTDGLYYVDFVVLVAYFLLLRIVCFMILRWRVNRRS